MDTIDSPVSDKTRFFSTLFHAPIPRVTREIDLELDTEDVYCYLDCQVTQTYGDYRKLPKQKTMGLANSYLLQKMQCDDGRYYWVAILPPVETVGRRADDAFAAIDFYLDGSLRGGDIRSVYLEKITSDALSL